MQVVFYYLMPNNKVTYVSKDNDEIKEGPYSVIQGMNHLEILTGYSQSHEDLLKFKLDMINMSTDIKKVKIATSRDPTKRKFYNLDYLSYPSHSAAAKMQFHQATGNRMSRIKDSPVYADEFYFHEKMLKSGLMTLNPDYRNIVTDCYGYDFSRYYVHLMIDKEFKFPIQAGIEKRFKSINYGRLRFGIYHVKIDCDNNRFRSMFNFSPDNHYDNETIMYLNSIKKQYGIKLQLVTDGKPNAYIYENYENGYDHFYPWYFRLEQVRLKCDNALVKIMMSTLWGRLTAFKYEFITSDEMEEYDITHRHNKEESEYKIIENVDTDDNNIQKYKIVNTNDPFKTAYGRMKSFLTSFGRLKMLKMIHEFDMPDVVRIHTDGIILSKPFDMKLVSSMWDEEVHGQGYYPKVDKKITGKIKFFNVLRSCRED
jgi:hypothetical protein